MQCVIVKAGTRCTSEGPGITLPLVQPGTQALICYDCVYDLYQYMTVKDITPTTISPEQVRKEMGLA